MDRKSTGARTGVVSGSVWETRMMNDEIMGGFKVFEEKQNPDELKQSPVGKRRAWKSENSIRIGGNAAKKSPNSKVKEVHERNPVRIRKSKPEEVEKSPIRRMKARSETSVSSEGNPVRIENDSAQSEETKAECAEVSEESKPKSESVPEKVSDEPKKTAIESKTEKLELKMDAGESIGKTEKTPVEIQKIRSDSGEENTISRDLINVGNIKSAPKLDDDQKPNQIVSFEKKSNQKIEKSSPIVKKKFNLSPARTKSIPDFDGFQSQSNPQRFPQTHGKLQSLIDLVMWRDVPRSAFVFGIGTFFIISSSYTHDLNFSLISVFGYLGLVYLAAIFIFKSTNFRGDVNIGDTSEEYYIIGEKEAVWLLKMIIPYLNEFIIKIRILFSGDPATTIKLGVVLFVLARSGSSITIWKMAKLGFFGVFTVPKICSSYSAQLTAHGKFWVRRFRDAWESCSHKKAVGFGVFALVWNLSSVVARIWAVFMLFVAIKYYQQSMASDGDCSTEERPIREPSTWQGHVGGRRLRRVPTNVVIASKEKKKF